MDKIDLEEILMVKYCLPQWPARNHFIFQFVTIWIPNIWILGILKVSWTIWIINHLQTRLVLFWPALSCIQILTAQWLSEYCSVIKFGIFCIILSNGLCLVFKWHLNGPDFRDFLCHMNPAMGLTFKYC